MTYAQYWILDAVAEDRYALSTLREDVVENAFNRKGHGLTRPQLIKTLTDLFSDGDIFVTYDDDSEQHTLSETEIGAAFMSSRWVWYGLTQQGGAKWEAISRPEWLRFITGGLNEEANDCDVASANRAAIAEYLHDDRVRDRIIPASVVWQEILDWQATYWKSLPAGFEVHFRITNPSEDFMVAQPPKNWYTNPFA